MQKNSTDHIAKLAFDTVKTHWKVFLLLPLAPLAVSMVFGFLMSLSASRYGMGSSMADLIAWIQLLYLAVVIFFFVYSTAAAKWCSDIFEGKKEIDIKEGFSYGLSRLGGMLGTTLLTFLKVGLWSMLFVIPGLYKLLVYSQSISISQLNKISGNNANRLSAVLINEAGILRTLGNYMTLFALMYLSVLALYLLAILFIPLAILSESQGTGVPMVIGGIGVGVLFIGWMAWITAFMMCFKNFQFLIFRDENNAAFQKAIKGLPQQ